MQLLKKAYAVFSTKERVVFFAAVGIFLLSSIILIAIIARTDTHTVPAPGGTYREGMTGQPSLVNPVLAESEVDKSLVRLIFANLGQLAEEISRDSRDPSVWQVRLKENLQWQDGQKLTSDDVVFTIEKIQDTSRQSPLYTAWEGIRAQRVSELEIKIILPAPYALFGDTVHSLSVAPKHLFADIPLANWRLSEYNLQPVGSGPYKFEGYDTQSDGFIRTYALRPNPSYAHGQPFIQNIVFHFYTDAQNLMSAFNTGRIDGFAGIDTELISQIRRPYNSVPLTIPGYYAVFFNQNKNLALQDAQTRHALSLAINREVLVEKALHGEGVPMTGPLPANAAEEAPTSTSTQPANPASLLDAAGWKLTAEGARVKVSGRASSTLTITLTVPEVDFLVATAQEVKAMWEAIGVRTTIAVQDSQTLAQTTIKNRDYEALLFGNVLTPSYDLFSFWHSSQRFFPGLNLSLYNNPQADRLIETLRTSFDTAAQTQAREQLGALIETQHPAAFLYSPVYHYVSSRSLNGVQSAVVTELADRFENAAQWYLRTRRVVNEEEHID